MIREYVDFDKLDWGLYLRPLDAVHNRSTRTLTPFTLFCFDYGQYPQSISLERLDSNSPLADVFLIRIKQFVETSKEKIDKCNKSILALTNENCFKYRSKMATKSCFPRKHFLLRDESDFKKLCPKLCGPFQFTKKINNVTSRQNYLY